MRYFRLRTNQTKRKSQLTAGLDSVDSKTSLVQAEAKKLGSALVMRHVSLLEYIVPGIAFDDENEGYSKTQGSVLQMLGKICTRQVTFLLP